jgi:hypothetical protein
MGANAQTTVPTFTAAQVLTAAQMNNSARTGVPVFADTTARDAAFGGAGEKTLAEGQLCYIEASDIVQYYDGSAWKTLAPFADSAEIATLQNSTSTTFGDLATVGPAVTMTTGTKVLVFVTCGTISPGGTSGTGHMGVAVSGASSISAVDTSCMILFSNNNVRSWALSYVFPLTVTAGSNTFTAKYKTQTGGSTSGFENRKITVIAL